MGEFRFPTPKTDVFNEEASMSEFRFPDPKTDVMSEVRVGPQLSPGLPGGDKQAFVDEFGMPGGSPAGLLLYEPKPIEPLNVDGDKVKFQNISFLRTDSEGHLLLQKYRMWCPKEPTQSSVHGLVVLSNGRLPNSKSEVAYQSGYDYLAECLAARGFVALIVPHIFEIDIHVDAMLGCMNHLMAAQGTSLFLTGKSLAFVGHSRAGQTVTLAARAVSSGQSVHFKSVRAVIGLAPVGFSVYEDAFADSLLVIQGTLDDDTTTWGAHSFEPYLRSTKIKSRYFLWMFGVNHTQFTDQSGFIPFIGNPDYDSARSFPPDDLSHMVRRQTQQMVVKNYVTSFLLWKIRGDQQYAPLFRGENRFGFKDIPGFDDIKKGRFMAFPQYKEKTSVIGVGGWSQDIVFEQMQQNGSDISAKNPALFVPLTSKGEQFQYQSQSAYVVGWNREGVNKKPRIVLNLYNIVQKPVAIQFNLVQTINAQMNDNNTTIAKVFLRRGLAVSKVVKIVVERPQPVSLTGGSGGPLTRSLLSVVRIQTGKLAPGNYYDFFFAPPGCQLVIDFTESRVKGEIAITDFSSALV